MLQFGLIGMDTRSLYIPTGIDKLEIDGQQHLQYISQFNEKNPLLKVVAESATETIRY